MIRVMRRSDPNRTEIVVTIVLALQLSLGASTQQKGDGSSEQAQQKTTSQPQSASIEY